MAGMKVSELDFLQLLPVSMRDDEAVTALSTAMDSLLGTPSVRIPVLRTWDMIDELTSEECDELAWELDIDWYDSVNLTLTQKRETIKCAMQVKRKRGTKAAVLQMLEAYLGLDCDLVEWFEFEDFYGETDAQPYTFDIITESDLIDPLEYMEHISGLISKVKNVRSHLRYVMFLREEITPVYAAVQPYSYAVVTIWNSFDAGYSTGANPHAAASTESHPAITISNEHDAQYGAMAALAAGTGAGSYSTVTVENHCEAEHTQELGLASASETEHYSFITIGNHHSAEYSQGLELSSASEAENYQNITVGNSMEAESETGASAYSGTGTEAYREVTISNGN